ncbi:MAG: flagellin [Limnohabitans sp.]|nr:MAG: flagellin [Limnohabitans sp.]
MCRSIDTAAARFCRPEHARGHAMTVINTNIKSLISQNALNLNSRALSSAMEQLSTGKRINSAKDDAAGLAISSRMTAQIKGLDQAIRNANDGISLLQTTEGATIEMTNMLQRMRELAVQSANDTNTTDDRAYLDLEYQQLTKEIARIASNTQWNGMNILNNTQVGTAGTAADVGLGVRNVKFQVGANADQIINIGLKDFSYGTGTPAVKSEAQLNLSAAALTGAKNFSLSIGSTTFNVSLTSAIAGATTSTSEAGDLATQLSTTINNTVGFENVTVTTVGTTINISDAQGRTIGSTFDVKTAAGASVTATGVKTTIASGSLAVGATTPPVTAVFSGNARLNDTNITSQANANTAIDRLDNAIDAINSERAQMGAVMNRLTYAADNLTNVSQNTTASRSQILDTDYAKASSELSRTQIIQQAATAVLAQANTDQQTVLKLLQN